MPRLSVSEYVGLASGPGFSVQSQKAQSFPVDGSKASLRDPTRGSPFSFRVVPPDALLAALAGQGSPSSAGTFSAALAEQRAEIEASIAAGTATQQQLDLLAGTRAPATPSFAVIDAALATTTNFKQTQNLRQTAAKKLLAPQTAHPTPLIGGNGKRFNDFRQDNARDMAISDLAQGRSVLNQVRRMLATPALTLLVNPQSLNVTFTKKQVYQDRSRYDYIFQSWGEELPRLSVSGKTGAFYAGASSEVVDARGFTSSPSGVQWICRRDSAAWQNLSALLLLYRNNGLVYDLLGNSEAHLWVGAIEINYDQNVYHGQFESFSFGFTEDHQGGGVEFNFDFSVSQMFDLAQRGTVDPQSSPTPSASDPRWVRRMTPSRLPESQTTQKTSPTEESSTAILDPFVG